VLLGLILTLTGLCLFGPFCLESAQRRARGRRPSCPDPALLVPSCAELELAIADPAYMERLCADHAERLRQAIREGS
jgi:hypothetical protein